MFLKLFLTHTHTKQNDSMNKTRSLLLVFEAPSNWEMLTHTQHINPSYRE